MSVDFFALGKQQISVDRRCGFKRRPPTTTPPPPLPLLDLRDGAIGRRRVQSTRHNVSAAFFLCYKRLFFLSFSFLEPNSYSVDCCAVLALRITKVIKYIIGRHPNSLPTTLKLPPPTFKTLDGCKWPYISTPTPMSESVLCMRTRLDFYDLGGSTSFYFFILFSSSVMCLYTKFQSKKDGRTLSLIAS